MSTFDTSSVDAVVGPLVVEAGEIALRSFRTAVAATDKGGSQGYDPVTEADRATEAFLRAELTARFPDHRVVGEEQGVTGPGGGPCWLIDPIDGTKAYVTGVPAWGVLVGLVVDDRPVAGWVRQPYLDETFAAADGDGYFAHAGERRSLRAAPTTALAEASLYTTHPSMFATAAERGAYDELTRRVRLQRFGGDCYSYCLLALGHIDLVVESGLHPYDIVALVPIIEAAGGVVSDLDGRTPTAGGFVVAAATAQLHDEALRVLDHPAPRGGRPA